eukprot:5651032-Prymnesium_polylepis.1
MLNLLRARGVAYGFAGIDPCNYSHVIAQVRYPPGAARWAVSPRLRRTERGTRVRRRARSRRDWCA